MSLSVCAQAGENCNGRQVNCLMDPCSVASCPAFSAAECVPDFCNGCSAKFVVRGVTVTEQDCGENVLSQTSSVNQASLRNSPLLGGLLGGAGNSRNSGVFQNPMEAIGSRGSNLLGRLLGGVRPSGNSGSQQQGGRTPIFRDLVSRISQWQPMDQNSRNKMENFLGGLLNKVFSRLG